MLQRTKELDQISTLEKDKFEAFFVENLKVPKESVRAEVRNTVGDKIGKELLHLAPSPYYMPYPYDEGLNSHPTNMKGEWGEVYAVKLEILKKELFKDPKVRKAIIDQVPTPTQLLRAYDLTLKELSGRMNILMYLRFSWR
nr:hypothetical protein [Tanacetum cinerariifolium]